MHFPKILSKVGSMMGVLLFYCPILIELINLGQKLGLIWASIRVFLLVSPCHHMKPTVSNGGGSGHIVTSEKNEER